MAYTKTAAFAGRGSALQYGNGAASPFTFAVLAEVKKIQFSGTKADLADVTNMESGNVREWLPTLIDSGELSGECNLIPNDASQAQLNNFFNNQTLVPWQVVLPNGADGNPLGVFAFNAYVTSHEIDIPLDKEAMISFKLKITGVITFWTE